MGQWIATGLVPMRYQLDRGALKPPLGCRKGWADALTIEWEPRIYEATLHTLLYVLAGAVARIRASCWWP